jgi:hypothetical protein
MLCWVRIDVPMQMGENPRVVDKKLRDNNEQIKDTKRWPRNGRGSSLNFAQSNASSWGT